MSKLFKCQVCNKNKQLNEFYLRSNGLVGEYKCKLCIQSKRKVKYTVDYESVRECNRKAVSEFQKRNRDKNCAKTSQYRSKKLNAVPKWLSKEDVAKMRSIYKSCKLISKKTGIRHEVDHIVPLNHPLVQGLHVPWNLQILTAEENKKKSNSLIEEIV